MKITENKIATIAKSMAALGSLPSVQTAAIFAAEWEKRAAVWKLENPAPEFYDETLELYTRLGHSLIAMGRGPLKAAPVKIWTSAGTYSTRWLTLKEVAQELIGRELPDIHPADAVELARSSPFSAEAWWQGCTDRIKWE